MKKKGMEMSINLVVIIVVALVTLGLILTFVTGIFDDIEIPVFPKISIPATANDPIVIVPVEVKRGETTGMSISFYNNEEADITITAVPTITCAGITDLEFSAAGLNIAMGDENKYSVVVRAPKTAKAGSYPCTATISSTQEQFKLEVS